MISITCILVRERPLDPKSEWPSSLATDQVENPGLTFSSRPLLCLEMSYFQKYLIENVRVVYLLFFQNLNTGLPLLHWPSWKYNPLALSCDLGLSSDILKKKNVCFTGNWTRSNWARKVREFSMFNVQCSMFMFNVLCTVYCGRGCVSLESERGKELA